MNIENPLSTSNQKEEGRSLTYLLLLASVFIMPFVFVPTLGQSQSVKVMLMGVAVLFGAILWFISALKKGSFTVPNTLILWSLGAVALLAIVLSFFSGTLTYSMFGYNFDVGTSSVLLIGFLLAFLTAISFRKNDRIFYAYVAFFIALVVLALFHISRMFLGADFLTFGFFENQITNTVGKWNDLGAFFAVGALFSMITLELLRLEKAYKILAYFGLVASLFILAVVNFLPLWILLGIFSITFLVYLISFKKLLISAPNEKAKIPVSAICVVVVSFVFVLAGSAINPKLSAYFGVSQIEARPSLDSTLSIVKNTLSSNPIFGAGPNNFTEEWLKYKPGAVNQSFFWNLDFNYGIGLIPTFLVTLGISGGILFILLLGVLGYKGFSAIIEEKIEISSQYLAISSFLLALFLWLYVIVYIPSFTMLALAYFFTGIFVAILSASRLIGEKTVVLLNNPKLGFISILSVIALMAGTVSFGYFLARQFAGQVYFYRGVSQSQAGNLDSAEASLNRAARYSSLDLHYRYLSELYLIKMKNVLQREVTPETQESIRANIQSLFASSLDSARRAVTLNPDNYENYLSLSRLYEFLMPLRIEGSYEKALENYDVALKLNPLSPAIYLSLARLESNRGDLIKAREYIQSALAIKGNYTDAIFLLSQIEVKDGDMEKALATAEAASIIAPNDPLVFFQLGLYRYNNKDFVRAVGALEKAVELNPSYANAKYFLGLSYEKIGKDADAIRQFEDLKLSNPDNAEIDLILKNLRAGKSPFAGARPPIDDSPEARGSLPVGDR